MRQKQRLASLFYYYYYSSGFRLSGWPDGISRHGIVHVQGMNDTKEFENLAWQVFVVSWLLFCTSSSDDPLFSPLY